MWNQIVIHHSASTDTENLDTKGIDRYHSETLHWRDVGYHFLVEKVDGYYTAVMGRPLFWFGSHEPKANKTGIGVCFIGNFSQTPISTEQLSTGAKLVAGLALLLGLGIDSIKPHRHFKATECPGKLFPWEDFLARVQRYLEHSEI